MNLTKTGVFLIIAATAVCSALMAGAVIWMLAAAPAGEEDTIATPSEQPVASDETAETELLARIDRLTMQNQTLQQRLDALEQRPVASARTPVGEFATVEALEELREELRALQGRPGVFAEEPVEFKQQIAGALTEIRREEAISKVRDYQEQRAERLEQDLQKLADWLKLDEGQVSGMRTSLLAQYDREAEVRRMWEAGESDEVLGERKRADGALFWEDVQQVLTPEQLESFGGYLRGARK